LKNEGRSFWDSTSSALLRLKHGGARRSKGDPVSDAENAAPEADEDVEGHRFDRAEKADKADRAEEPERAEEPDVEGHVFDKNEKHEKHEKNE
jgi:hypothetical protein